MNLASSSGMEFVGGKDYTSNSASAPPGPKIVGTPIPYSNPSPSRLPENQRVRLRVVETEGEHYLRMMNLDMFFKMAVVQAAAALVIIIAQILLYSLADPHSYKILDYVGVGLWGSQIFLVAGWLTYVTTKTPSACTVGTALGFQIISFLAAVLVFIVSTISLLQHGKYTTIRNYDYGTGLLKTRETYEYDPEVGGRVACSLIILGAFCETAVSLVLSILYCKLSCCSRANANEDAVFEVKPVTV